MTTLRLATRGSRLALAQVELARRALDAAGAGTSEAVVIRTQGDHKQSTPIERLEGQGWFTAELEAALLDGRADAAVHSAKDLPSQLGNGLEVTAHLERADPRDALVTRDHQTLAGLEPGSRVATSSARRVALLEAIRPDLDFVPMRGNVDTRLAKLDSGEIDALILAAAGLDRLGLGERAVERLDPAACVPAPCQGIVAIECVSGGDAARSCAVADSPDSRAAARCERAVLIALGGGCLIPLGAWARLEDGRLVCTAAFAVDGAIRRAELAGDPGRPEELGESVAARLR